LEFSSAVCNVEAGVLNPISKRANAQKKETGHRDARDASTLSRKQTILLAAFKCFKAAPPNPICYSPAAPDRADCVNCFADFKRFIRFAVTRAASDSLVDYRGCLTYWPERESLTGDINL
jgi:hypothetical protein